jgi:hypothetical protein
MQLLLRALLFSFKSEARSTKHQHANFLRSSIVQLTTDHVFALLWSKTQKRAIRKSKSNKRRTDNDSRGTYSIAPEADHTLHTDQYISSPSVSSSSSSMIIIIAPPSMFMTSCRHRCYANAPCVDVRVHRAIRPASKFSSSQRDSTISKVLSTKCCGHTGGSSSSGRGAGANNYVGRPKKKLVVTSHTHMNV